MLQLKTFELGTCSILGHSSSSVVGCDAQIVFSTGCEECNNAHSSVCPKHGPLHPIPNRPVLTRARASLPLVLYIDRFLGGVFSKRRIPKRTQFGPVEGPLVRESELKDCYIHLKVRDDYCLRHVACLSEMVCVSCQYFSLNAYCFLNFILMFAF